MKKIMTLYLSSFFLAGSALAVLPSDFEVQDWWAPGEVGMILYNAKKMFPEMRVSQDDNFDEQIEPNGSYCFMRVAFPRERHTAGRSERNHMTCYLRDTGGDYAILTLDLGGVEVMSWGTKPMYDFWEKEGLPKAFQFLDQDINLRIYRAMLKAVQIPEFDKFISFGSGCDQSREVCTNHVSFLNAADSSRVSNYLRCQVKFKNDVKFADGCVFFYPDEHPLDILWQTVNQ